MANNLISFNQDVAKVLGIPEAIILKEIAHWVGKKGKSDAHNTFDGLRYTYNSIPELTEKFTCLSEHTIRRALQSLKDKELLLCRSRGRFHDKKGIKWSNSYTINLPVYEALFSSLLEVTPVQNGQVKQNARIPVQNGQVKTEYQSKLDGLNQATTNTNTTNTFPLKKEDLPINTTVHRENLAPRLDTSSGTGTEITPNNLANIQAKCPTATAKLINSTWIEQEGYWRDKNLSNYLLEGKVIARICDKEGKKKRRIFVQE